ncbi:MAG: metallophosphoesterase family protein [Pseudomonadota bacterium]
MPEGAFGAMRRLIGAQPASGSALLDALPRPRIAGRVYAVGDVHGRADLLKRLLGRIYDDARRAPPDTPLSLILLGDYIDRGEDSKGVLELCSRLRAEAPVDEVVFIRGNHEAALLSFLRDPAYGEQWLAWGGVETLASYGVAAPWERAREKDYEGLRDDLSAAMGAHATLLASQTTSMWRTGNIFFCHAAIDPDAPITAQPDKALMWGDSRFMHRGGPEGMVVVHGHTVTEQPDIGRNRIGVDTGAYLSGVLSAVVIDANGFRFLAS